MIEKDFLLSNSRWLSAGVLLTFSTAFGQTFFISLFALEIRNEFSMSHTLWGSIYAAGTLSSAALMLLIGGLADKYPARIMALLTMAVFSLFCICMASVPKIWLLPIIIFGLRFCGQGMLGHLAMVFAGRWFAKNRGKTIAIASLGLSISEAILPFIFVTLVGIIGWRLSWGVAAILIILLAIPLFFLLSKERNPQSSGDGEETNLAGMQGYHWDRKKVLLHWVFWLALPAFLAQHIFGTTFFFQQAYFSEIKGWSLDSYVALIPVYTVASLIGLFFAGFIIDRYGISFILPVYLLPMTLGFLISSNAVTLSAAALSFACMGLMQGMGTTVVGAFWPEFYGTKFLGSVRSVATSLMVFATALGPLSSGFFIDQGIGLEKQYTLMSAISLTSCLGMLYISLSRIASK